MTAYKIPFNKKIPNVLIESDTGICTKCHWQFYAEDGCTNEKCENFRKKYKKHNFSPPHPYFN